MSEVKEGALENMQGQFRNIDNKDTVSGMNRANRYEKNLREIESNRKAQKNAEEERNTIDPSNIVSQLKQDREDDLVR